MKLHLSLIKWLLSLLILVIVSVLPAFAGWTVRDGGTIPVGGLGSQGQNLAFEGNGEFATPPDTVIRISEPASVNGDGKAWQVHIEDPADGSQQFRSAGWALNGLNVSSATYLVFYVRGSAGFDPFEVGLQDTSFRSFRIRDAGSILHPNLGDYIVGGNTITTSYQQVRIPLSVFWDNGVNRTSLDAFQIITVAPDGQTIVVYIDAMGFE